MLRIRTMKAQSTAEYAVVIAIVLGAVIGMQTFVKRGLQGRYHDVTDAYTSVQGSGTLGGLSNLQQYEPYYAKSSMTTKSTDNWTEEMQVKDKVIRSGTISGRQRQTGGTQEETGYTDPNAVWK